MQITDVAKKIVTKCGRPDFFHPANGQYVSIISENKVSKTVFVENSLKSHKSCLKRNMINGTFNMELFLSTWTQK